jgi:hypothetical protein
MVFFSWESWRSGLSGFESRTGLPSCSLLWNSWNSCALFQNELLPAILIRTRTSKAFRTWKELIIPNGRDTDFSVSGRRNRRYKHCPDRLVLHSHRMTPRQTAVPRIHSQRPTIRDGGSLAPPARRVLRQTSSKDTLHDRKWGTNHPQRRLGRIAIFLHISCPNGEALALDEKSARHAVRSS